jgi:hypothetical protein
MRMYYTRFLAWSGIVSRIGFRLFADDFGNLASVKVETCRQRRCAQPLCTRNPEGGWRTDSVRGRSGVVVRSAWMPGFSSQEIVTTGSFPDAIELDPRAADWDACTLRSGAKPIVSVSGSKIE